MSSMQLKDILIDAYKHEIAGVLPDLFSSLPRDTTDQERADAIEDFTAQFIHELEAGGAYDREVNDAIRAAAHEIARYYA